MHTFYVFTKDLKQLVRDWKAAVFLVAMPVLFTLFFGFIFGGLGAEEDPRHPVGVLDRDEGGALGAHLLDLIEASGVVRPVVADGASLGDLEEEVQDGDLAAAVVVPPGYGERALGGEEAVLTVVLDGGSPSGVAARSALQVVSARLLGAAQAARLAAGAVEAPGSNAGETVLLRALEQAVEAWRDPPVGVAVVQAVAAGDDEAEESPWSANAYSHSSPGMMVQFSIAGVISAAGVIVLERKSRCLQRMLTTGVSRAAIVLGHFGAGFFMILLQIVLLMGFGQVLLGLDYAREPLAALLLAVTIALWTAGLGLLIGALARSEEQVIIFSMIPMFLLSGLGGAWMPLEMTSETFRAVGHLLPTAWAMDGLKNVIIRGQGLESVLPAAGVMVVYGVVLLALAVWRFRAE
jgi:ABC-2 type transport system permease protein